MSAAPASPPARPVLSTTSSKSSREASSGSRRQRVLWDSDNVSRGGKTSISVLLEWLLASGNYERWRNGKSQTGETREVLCSEIKRIMKQHGIHHRENANIRTQINELERSFDAARAWLKENGYDPYTFKRVTESAGLAVLGGPAEAHVLRMCRYYHTLNDVFGLDEDKGTRQRRTYFSKRTGLHPVVMKQRNVLLDEEIGREEPDLHSDVLVEHQRIEASKVVESVPVTTAAPVVIAPVSNITGSGTTPSAAKPDAGMIGTWTNPVALDNTQRMLAEAVREERERKRFCMEEERNSLQCEKLRYEIESAKLKLTIDRALARKKLFDAGLLEAQVNELIPK